MNNTSTSNTKTFMTGPIARVTVEIKAERPSFLPASFNILVTLNTLMILASYGKAFSAGMLLVLTREITMSKILALTTKKSNLFHVTLK